MIHCWSELLKFKRTERAKCSHIDSEKGKCLKFSRHFWLAGHCLQLHQSMQSGMCPLCALTANALECNKESFREWMQNDKYKSSKQYILSGNVMIILWFSHFFFFCMWKEYRWNAKRKMLSSFIHQCMFSNKYDIHSSMRQKRRNWKILISTQLQWMGTIAFQNRT